MDWAAVARAGYDGVEIRLPMGHERGDRPYMEWLDRDWDLVSGCAWNCERIVAELVEPGQEPGLSF